ncbi:ATP-binding protein [Ramlibacter algicola]|uniref:histidine kinase n=1 Tax=Ramlibacter algicola TaxID=2795217 RepID=A0A934PXM4_9BURK|nr:ATP-binding protein [Ramlibacter algicola]MBK0392405.1 response regulator [Ramlibacter algicola]
MRLRTSLFLLATLAAVPILAFALIAARYVVQAEDENLVNTSMARNSATMSAVDAELRGVTATLQALAGASSLGRNDLRTFHADAQAVLVTQPSWRNISLMTSGGQQLVNARVPWGAPLPAHPSDPTSLERLLRTREPVVGDLQRDGLPDNELGVTVRVPVLNEGVVRYVLTATLSAEPFRRLLEQQNLAPGWVGALVDGHGRVLARVPPVSVGSAASPEYLTRVQGATDGWYRGPGMGGEDDYTAFLRSGMTGWSLGYSVSAQVLNKGVKGAAWVMGAGMALSVIAGGLLALLLGRVVSRPMSQLATAARRWGDGVPVRAGVDSRIEEVQQLASALDRAAGAVTQRDAQLQQRAEELAQANAKKTQFLAMLSHELRNPLAPLRNGIAILRRTADPRRRSDVEAMMERQVAHAARLIDDLLDVSRIERGKLQLELGTVHVADMVRAAVEAVRPAIEARRQRLEVRSPAAALSLRGDSVRLAQVLSNLLTNASKFTPEGGHLRVEALAEGSELVLRVRDEGVGFEPDEGDRIFEMFTQLDTSRSKAVSGLGLGLAIVRSIVHMHGGTVCAYSEGQGSGATFTVRLPMLAQPVAANDAPGMPALPAPAGPRRVLVADDNVDAADSLAALLREEGFEVLVAHDGERALELARRSPPTAALLDLDMPGLDGHEVARALRSERGADVLLVALTGLGRPSDLQATRASGFDAHLTKPTPFEDVLEALQRRRAQRPVHA